MAPRQPGRTQPTIRHRRRDEDRSTNAAPSSGENVPPTSAAPPSEFIRERNALVARLTKADQPKAAARVKAVPRPTVPVWAVNRLGRDERAGVEQLITATERMRSAQLGRGDRSRDLSAASADHRAALAHLGERAEAVLHEAGFAVTHQVRLRIETTLTAAAADPGLREALRQGHVERELTARGFDVFAGEKFPPRAHPTPATAKPTTGAARRATGETPQAKEAEAREQRESRVAEANERLDRAEAEATARRERLSAARQRVGELRRLLAEAARTEAQAAREERHAAAALNAAQKALRAAQGASATARRRHRA
jgi:hypothetical protein